MQDSPLYDVQQICDLKEMLAASVERFGDNSAFLRKQAPSSAYEPVSFRQFQSDVNAFGTAVASFSAGLRLHPIRNLFRARWSYLVQHPVGRIANAIGQCIGVRPQSLPMSPPKLLKLIDEHKARNGG